MRLNSEQQADLFSFNPSTLHRRTDPATSRKAAEAAVEFAGNHEDIIRECLRRCGPLTADEIALKTPLDPVQVNRRLSGMKSKGLAHPTGEVRKSLSGRPERVWAV